MIPVAFTVNKAIECQWLNQEHNFPRENYAATPELMKTLESAIHYLDSRLSAQEHDLAVCHCEGCFWLRCAECLYEQAKESRLRN